MLEYKRIVLLLLFSIQIVIAQEHENQEASIFVGVGPTLELANNFYGVNARVYYGINEKICFGPEVSYLPFQRVKEDVEQSILDLNINAHYIIELSEKIGVYGLSGLNYTKDTKRFLHEDEVEKAFGLNYGAGLHYRIQNWFFFTEFKGIIGHLNDEFITIGTIVNIPI
ncbi:outer membrane beta-barrel protein [Tenacibaculum agarivorans]|uniref:outer membrane beta-barrel protein n=1 Tax=Tenacibaculum agarivorans TaxID=1908389 RepID=UPI00094B9686|nr:outer membrane beta-barrel protein [Tenacibaculum agarivorans]